MLHKTIASLRRKHGWSQEQLAERVGVSRQTVSKWETGTSVPELEKLVLMSQCFGITIDQLLGGDHGAPVTCATQQGFSAMRLYWRKILGLILTVSGLVYGLLTLWIYSQNTALAQQINAMFRIEISGTGVMLGLSLGLLGIGCWLVLKKS